MRIAVVLGVAGLLVYGAAGADYTDREDVRQPRVASDELTLVGQIVDAEK